MSKNRDKEYGKEVENTKKSQIAWIKEYAPEALTPEEIIEKIVEKEIEVPVEVIKIEKEFVEKIVDNPEHIKMIETLNINMEAAAVSILEYQESVKAGQKQLDDLNSEVLNYKKEADYDKSQLKDNELIIKKQSETILKLKKAVKELSSE